jgi:hypothetical protein
MDNEDYNYVITNLADVQADIIGLAETNTAWQHFFLRQMFQKAVRQHGASLTKISFGSPNKTIDDIPVSETFQAGGSTTFIMGPWTTAVIGKEVHDTTGLGQWSGLHIRGRHGNTLSVITGYRTCTGSIRTAPLGSTFHREYEYYRHDQKTGSAPNPRLHFLKDIERLIHTLQDEGNHIVLMLDANSVLTSDKQFRDTMDRLQLTDLHRNDPAPSTYIGAANRRIDYMFGSTRVTETLMASGTLSYVDGPQSDHRGMYIDINANAFLQHDANANHIQPSQCRTLKSGNPEIVAEYHKGMHTYYESHRMVERIDNLYENHKTMRPSTIRDILHKWDADQGRAMVSSENTLNRRSQRNHWSPQLRNAGITYRYWGLRLKSFPNSSFSNLYSRLESSARQHDPDFRLPSLDVQLLPSEIAQHRKKARKDLRDCQRMSKELRHHTYQDLLIRYGATMIQTPNTNPTAEQK